MNNEQLIMLLMLNSSFEVDAQHDRQQVAVWCESFGKKWSICYQNGDMNGNKKGTACFKNDGANEGLDELRDILSDVAEFKHLIDETTYHSHLELEEFIDSFVSNLSAVLRDKILNNTIDEVIESYEIDKND